MKLIAKSMTVLMIALGLVACGGNDKKVAYRPVAFGENNQCYYVDNPAEAQMLINQGLCERHWAPTAMPVYWHQMYYPYYASPAYYNTYVPVATRTVYVTNQKTWGQQNKTAIAEKAKAATYKASNGKTVPAEKIGATKYGAGNRFGPTGAKFGGGARNATPDPPQAPSKENIKPTDANPTPVTSKAPAPKAPKPTPSPQPKSSGGIKSGGKSGGSGGYKPSGGSKPSGGYGGGVRSGGGFGGGKR